MSEVVGVEDGFDEDDGKENSALATEECDSEIDEDHDENDFNDNQQWREDKVDDTVNKMKNSLAPAISNMNTIKSSDCFHS